MLSIHCFLCLPRFLAPGTVPRKMVFDIVWWHVTWPNQAIFIILMMESSSSCLPTFCLIVALTYSCVFLSCHDIPSRHFISKPSIRLTSSDDSRAAFTTIEDDGKNKRLVHFEIDKNSFALPDSKKSSYWWCCHPWQVLISLQILGDHLLLLLLLGTWSCLLFLIVPLSLWCLPFCWCWWPVFCFVWWSLPMHLKQPLLYMYWIGNFTWLDLQLWHLNFTLLVSQWQYMNIKCSIQTINKPLIICWIFKI